MVRLWVSVQSGPLETWTLAAAGWDAPGVHVRRALTATGETWVVIAETGAAVLVNGEPVRIGLRVLTNRDDLRTGDGTRAVFSDECRATEVPFPSGLAAVRCARCTGDLAPGEPAVQCPGCRCWYHEHGDFVCWSSIPFCQSCGRTTGVVADDAWVPEET